MAQTYLLLFDRLIEQANKDPSTEKVVGTFTNYDLLIKEENLKKLSNLGFMCYIFPFFHNETDKEISSYLQNAAALDSGEKALIILMGKNREIQRMQISEIGDINLEQNYTEDFINSFFPDEGGVIRPGIMITGSLTGGSKVMFCHTENASVLSNIIQNIKIIISKYHSSDTITIDDQISIFLSKSGYKYKISSRKSSHAKIAELYNTVKNNKSDIFALMGL